jgi:hypothetical protein
MADEPTRPPKSKPRNGDEARVKRKRKPNVEVTGYVSHTLKQRVQAHVKREGLTESKIVGTAVRDYFFRQGSQVPEQSACEAFAAWSLPSLDEVGASAMVLSIAELPVTANAVRRRRRRRRRHCCCCRYCPRQRKQGALERA